MVIFSFIKWPKACLFFFLPPQPPEEFLGFSLRTRPHPRPSPSQPGLLSYIPLAVYAPRCSETKNAAACLLNDVLFGDHVTPSLQHPHGIPGVRQGASAGLQALLEIRLGLGAMGFLPRRRRSESLAGTGTLGWRRTWVRSCWCRTLEPPRQLDGTSPRRHQEVYAPTKESIYRNLKPVLTLEGPQEVDPATES